LILGNFKLTFEDTGYLFAITLLISTACYFFLCLEKFYAKKNIPI